MRLAAWVGERSIIGVIHALAHAVFDVVVDDVVQLGVSKLKMRS